MNQVIGLTVEEQLLEEELFRKILILNEIAWENKVKKPSILIWLNNFSNSKEKLHALFIISQFMYFGSRQVRTLLNALYRDMYKYPKIEQIRKQNGDSVDSALINSKFKEQLDRTRFLGVGNPSESGVHLLYFFRQENKLAKKLFIHGHEIFRRNTTTKELELNDGTVDHYVFIDDFCGSGTQAVRYTKRIVEDLKKLIPSAKVDYLTLFATLGGKEFVKRDTQFDHVDSVFALDDSFRCFHDRSRYFHKAPALIDKDFAEALCKRKGKELMTIICKLEGIGSTMIDACAEQHALGFDDSQLLLGFHHNTPDNTLPIIWFDEKEYFSWSPIFRRYNKNYGS